MWGEARGKRRESGRLAFGRGRDGRECGVEGEEGEAEDDEVLNRKRCLSNRGLITLER